MSQWKGITISQEREELNELALFAGAGGGLLASELLGWRTVCAVEIEPYARSVLLARQNDRIIRPFPIWDDVKSFDGSHWRGVVDVVSGGFPCTDISIIKALWGRKGLRGESSGLWWEYLRIVDECQPRYLFGENSPELKTHGLDQIVHSLSVRGYVCKWATLGADDCGFPHVRKRLWFLASRADCKGLEGHAGHEDDQGGRENEVGSASDDFVRCCSFCGFELETDDKYGCPNCLGQGLGCDDPWSELLPGITGMADGVANRMDRLKAIGNGQVPAVAVFAWRTLLNS